MPVLLLSCPDRPGLVARTAEFIADQGGNIVDADQHTDAHHALFLQRIEFDLPASRSIETFETLFRTIADDLSMTWALHRADERPRTALLVSKEAHCLYDLLSRVATGDVTLDVTSIISNHPDHRIAAERFDVPFVHLPIDPGDVAAQPTQLLEVLEEQAVELVILARYMRVLPPSIVDRFPNRIINIHHSFLPAFAGADPYRRAHERGVKIIGATAHYVTAELDAGPIISQEVTHVSHRDSVESLIRRGGDLEQTVLARAVRLHLEHRVLASGNRTVVFD